MFFCKKIPPIALIIFLVSGIPTVASALSQEAQIDIHVSKMKSAFTAGNYTKALESINKLKSLNINLGVEIIYFEGKALAETGNSLKAFNIVNKYIDMAGRNGSNYTAALELHSHLEDKINADKKEAVHQAGLRQQKKAKLSRMRADFKRLHPLIIKTLTQLCSRPISATSPSDYMILDAVNCYADGTIDFIYLKTYENHITYQADFYIYNYEMIFQPAYNIVDITTKWGDINYSTNGVKDHTSYGYIKYITKNSSSSEFKKRGTITLKNGRNTKSEFKKRKNARTYKEFKLSIYDKDGRGKRQWEYALKIKKQLYKLSQAVKRFKGTYGEAGLRKMLSATTPKQIKKRPSALLQLYKKEYFESLPYLDKIPGANLNNLSKARIN